MLLLHGDARISSAGILAALLGLISGVLLVIGLLTVLASLLISFLCAYAFSPAPFAAYAFNSFDGAVLGTVVSFALVLLGPGAFSADARLFGPREIVILPGRDRSVRGGK